MDEVEEVKTKTDIVAVIGEYVPLKKAGRNWKGLCPFHGEKTPSFMVNQELQIYKCFGCSEGGDVFSFLEKIEGMEFGEALRILAKRAGVTLKERVVDTPSGRQKDRLYQINHLAEEFYHYLLTEHRVGKAALEYVLKRGISKESVELFKLGFSPNMWDGLQQFMVGRKKAQAEELEMAGLVIKKANSRPGERAYYDRFRGRLMFPLRDHRGNAVGFSGRVIPGVTQQEKDQEGPKYVNTPETPVYQKGMVLYGLDLSRSEIKKLDQVVLVEGQMDTVSSYQAGVKNVAGVGGTALTADHVRILRRLATEMVVALDADIAGDAAARRGIELSDAAGFSIKVVKLKYGKDPDECAQKSPDLWKSSVAGAVPVYDFLMDSAQERYGINTAEGKRRMGRELIPIWAKIADPIMRASLTHTLAGRLGVSEVVVGQEVERERARVAASGKTKEEESVLEKDIEKTRRERLEEYLLALGFQKDWKILSKEDVQRLVRRSAAKRVLETLASAGKVNKVEKFAELLPQEMRMFFGEIMLIDVSEVTAEDSKWEKEVERVKSDLEELDLREEKEKIQREMEKLEDTDQEKKMAALMEDFKKVTEALGRLEKRI